MDANNTQFTAFGVLFKELRIKRGYTLRSFCLEYDFDPGNISKIERGIFPPPENSDILNKYAHCLGILEGSSVWVKFHDLAYTQKGMIPPDLMEKDLVTELPVFFRTIRRKKLTREEIEKLIEHIRKS